MPRTLDAPREGEATDGGLLSAEEYYRLPEEPGWRDELVEGSVVREPMPSFGHGSASVRIASLLLEWVEPRKLGEVVGECGFVVRRNPDTVRGPDAAFVSAERLAAWSGEGPFFEGAPDLAVEVLSPSNTRDEIGQKVREYLAAGARLVWVVDPASESVAVHRTGAAERRLGPDDALDGGEVLPGFTLPVRRIFP
ncbi:MAG: Uma2 family endonuclease [Thermoanaerobaculia bacterium]